MKREGESVGDINDIDRLSDLPDFVLLHIMEFMDIKHAVQTCALSKQWKNLWKSLTNLKLHCFDRSDIFSKFVSRILSCRDDSVPLHNLDFMQIDPPETTLLEVIKYAASHKVQQFSIVVLFSIDHQLKLTHYFELPPSIFNCRSLTFLKLDFWMFYNTDNRIKFPKSLNLPALKKLHLKCVTFSTSDNGCAEPFSTCNMLNTLVIIGCYLQRDAQALYVTNSNLSCLTIGSFHVYQKVHAYKVVLCTPKLSSVSSQGCHIYQASSVCNLPFLEKVNIDVTVTSYYTKKEGFALISWLQVFANVKIMTLSSGTLLLLKALSNQVSMRTQPPCFVRLESLEVELRSFSTISDEKGSRIVKYLLQNSPLAKVDIITHA